MRPQSLITEATTPRWSRRSTLTDSMRTPSNFMALSPQDIQGRVYNLFLFCTCSMSVQGRENDQSRVVRHRHIHDPGIQQEPSAFTGGGVRHYDRDRPLFSA